MESSSNLLDLQKAANYRLLRKTLRAGGIWRIVFGAFALFSGLPGVGTNPMSTVITVLGAVLLAEGLWTVFFTTPKGVIFDGSTMILIGAWNIIASIPKTSPSGLRGFVILGVLQIFWGLRRFKRYKMLTNLQVVKPAPQLLKWMDNVAILIFSAKPFEYGDVIAMQTQDGTRAIWKALISGDTAVFIENFGDRMLFAGKDDIEMHRLDSSTSSELAKIAVQVQGVSFTAVTPIQHLDRFEIWRKSLNEGDWAGFNGKKLAESIDWEQIRLTVDERRYEENG